MSQKIEFQSHVGENDVMVEATYTPGHSGSMPSLGDPYGEQPEEPEVEIDRVYIEHECCEGARIEIDLDIEGLFIRKWHADLSLQISLGTYRYESIEERLIEAAIQYVTAHELMVTKVRQKE